MIVADESVQWTRPDTLLLIKIKKEKTLWNKIAELMKLHKYSYTSDQCEGRWKTLMKSLKKVTDHNAKTGNDLKKHPYEAQLDFIIDRPNIKPAYIQGSTTDSSLDDENTTNAGNDSDSDSSVSDRSTTTPSPAPAPVPAKKKRSNVSEVLDVLKEHMSVQNARQQEAMQHSKNNRNKYSDKQNLCLIGHVSHHFTPYLCFDHF